ncbi:hypothetical protein Gogos_009160, partial [Gossypium gossypioides]|nr:hypothetical protein [Gossypium gossypioides]
MMEISKTHVDNKLCYAVYKEQFEWGQNFSWVDYLRLPSGGFVVDRFQGGIRGDEESRYFLMVYTEVDGDFS